MSPQKNSSRMVMSEINVTPLVDVMLVLLVVFMITAPMMQQGIDINLPKTATAGIQNKDEPFVLIIKQNRKVYIGDTAIPIQTLQAKVGAIFKNRDSKQVYIKADKAVDYGVVAEVIAEIKAAGIENVGLVTITK